MAKHKIPQWRKEAQRPPSERPVSVSHVEQLDQYNAYLTLALRLAPKGAELERRDLGGPPISPPVAGSIQWIYHGPHIDRRNYFGLEGKGIVVQCRATETRFTLRGVVINDVSSVYSIERFQLKGAPSFTHWRVKCRTT